MSASAPTTLLGRYRVIRRLGAGGMATVFLAEDERLRRPVAVKRLHAESPEEMSRRLEREARVGASLNHPNIVSVYDTDCDPEGVVIVMEYVDGESLAAALRRGPLTTEEGLEVIRSVASALDHAHARGVVHRDVKPANVLLTRTGLAKLADLGIAQAAEQSSLTGTGTVLGTASYMAPEQLEGRRVGPAADVYALAAVAFEILSGRRAREGATPVEVAHRVTTEPPPDLRDAWPDAPAGAAAALSRGMAHDPKRRPGSAEELARRLSESFEEEPTAVFQPVSAAPPRPAPAPPPPPAPRSRPPTPAPDPRSARRRSLAARVGAAVAVVAAGVALLLLVGGLGSGGDDPSPERAASGGNSAEGAQEGGNEAVSAPAEAAPEEVEPPALWAPAGQADPERGAALDAQGKSLIDQGRPEEAIPVLQEAVTSFPQGTDDIRYAYALYNLGNALRLAGRPAEAIPVLEHRLAVSSDQQPVVEAELEQARAEAAAG